MADRSETTQEILLDIRVAEASRLYKMYLNQEKKILGSAAVIIFLIIWELVGNVLLRVLPTSRPDAHERPIAHRESGI